MKARFDLAILLVVLSLSCCVASLFGLNQRTHRVVQVNPSTGVETPIGTKSYPKEFQAEGVASIDAQRKLYYTMATNTSDGKPHLIGLSLKTGLLVHSLGLLLDPQHNVSAGLFCAVIPATGEVITYGCNLTQSCLIQKVKFNGPTTLITRVASALWGLPSGAAYSSHHDMFIYQVYKRTEYIDEGIYNVGYRIVDGRQVLDDSDFYSLQTMAYDGLTKTVISVGFDRSQVAVVVSLQTSGSEKVLVPIPGYLVAESAALDEVHRILHTYIQPQDDNRKQVHLVSIDIVSGDIVSQPEIGHPVFGLVFDNTL